MGMEYIQKALDTVIGANFQRQDLSRTITLLDGPPRPISQYAPQIPAKGTIHYWDEQNLIKAGNGAATYAEGARPPADAVAPQRPTNVTCRTGKTASVTDDEAAVWTGAGSFELAEGELERLYQEAIDFQTFLKTTETLNEIEYMHLAGNSANSQAWAGGQCDGLITWITAKGVNFATGGTTGSPVNFTETMLRDGARQVAEGFTPVQPDTMLIPPELKVDVNGFVGGGAGRPLVQMITNDASGMIGGNEVDQYQTGYSKVNIRTEPYLSNTYNTNLPQAAVILYNKAMVKHAALIKLNAEPLARIATSVERMVTSVYTQEHRLPLHAVIFSNVKSAIA
jgi:hypothetical protein